MIKNYINYLLTLETKGIKLGLDRTLDLLKACNNPQKSLQSIQVVGTNGKGSTSAMIANILKCAGYKVGLTAGTLEDLELTEIAPDGAEIVRFGDNAATQSAFISGQVDVIVTGNTVAAQMGESNPN